MTNQELADWLEELDSHGIYDAAILNELPEELSSAIPTRTPAQVRRSIEHRGLGGYLVSEPAARMFSGWEASEAICSTVLGRNPGARYHGRGRSHRACIAGLRAAA